MYVYKELGLSYIPPSSEDFGRTPESQRFYSAQNGEIRFVLNRSFETQISQKEILQKLQKLGDDALMPGVTIYTKTTERYSDYQLQPTNMAKDFGHSVVYINGQILEMSGPSYWGQNEQGQYIGVDGDGSYPYTYYWVPNSSDPITQRLLFDFENLPPTETLVKGIPGSALSNDFIVQRITSTFSIVPAQPITPDTLQNYGFPTDQSKWKTVYPDAVKNAQGEIIDYGKACQLNTDTKNELLQQIYCPPTVAPSSTPTP